MASTIITLQLLAKRFEAECDEYIIVIQQKKQENLYP
jgi:hypothetical protein